MVFRNAYKSPATGLKIMMIRNTIIAAITLFSVLFSINANSAWWKFSDNDETSSSQTAATELVWEDLIPDDFVPPENPFASMSKEQIDKLMDGSDESNAEVERLRKQFNYAPVVPELDGQRVRIPAYITPLEYNSDSMIKEFLLVPYVGACIHTPPPPANQIVHAQSPEAIKFAGMYEPVIAIGTLRTETVKSDIAESGYRLEVEEVLPYTQE
ncbi:hypothetical protein AB833_09785 [Chromatiales bacterium (ex Bugula neritina AB1)]|nr:hypothetical protein AB833_09785 [Chromatiales bacterium (ex Bugula neritina AB1)]